MARSIPKSGAQIHFRVDGELLKAVDKRIKEKGARNTSAYLRKLVEKDLSAVPDEDRIDELVTLIGANHNRVTGLLRNLAMAQRAQFALLDASVKAMLSYLPPPGPDSAELLRARGKERYDRVLKSAEEASLQFLEQLLAQFDSRETEKGKHSSKKAV